MGSIATGGGDKGDTGVFGSGRLPKNHSRIEAYGSVDELNSEISVIIAAGNPPHASGGHNLPESIRTQLERIQSLLFDLGSDLAQPGCGKEDGPSTRIGDPHSNQLTEWIHEWESSLPALKNFIIPGGSLNAALLHRARTVCMKRVAAALERELPLVILNGEPFVALPRPPRLGRFSRYWREAEPVVWEGF